MHTGTHTYGGRAADRHATVVVVVAVGDGNVGYRLSNLLLSKRTQETEGNRYTLASKQLSKKDVHILSSRKASVLLSDRVLPCDRCI